MCPGVGLEEWLRWFTELLGGVECRGHALNFCSWLFRNGFFCVCVFLYLLSRMCPNCTCMQLCLVPDSFFVFCCWRKCVSKCKHGSKASQVPASLKGTESRLVMTVINYWTTVSFPLTLQEVTIFLGKPLTPRGGRRHGSSTRLLEVRRVQFCCSFSWCPSALSPCPNWRHLIFFWVIYWWDSKTTRECFSRIVSQPRASATPGNLN